QPLQIGILLAPCQLFTTQIKIAERTANGHVREAEVHAHAESRLVLERAIHMIQCSGQLAHLAVDPGLTAELWIAPVILDIDCNGSVQYTVGNGFPALDCSTVAPLLWQKPAHG